MQHQKFNVMREINFVSLALTLNFIVQVSNKSRTMRTDDYALRNCMK